MSLKKQVNKATPFTREKRLRESVAFDASSVLFAKNLPSRELGAEIQKIPSHWTYKNLSSLCEYSTGKTPARNNLEYWSNGEIPWMSISDMKQGEVVYKTKEKISNQAFKEKFSNKAVPKGALLMSFKLTIGRTCFAGVDLTHNEAIIAIYPKKTEIDKLYLSFYLPTVDYSIYQDRAIKGNTLNKSKINKIKIPLPPLEEQKKIAGVLSQIQKAMEIQDKLIERTIELKKTTMKHLFTYGTEKTSAKLSAKNLPSREWESKKIRFMPDNFFNPLWPMVELGDVCVFEYGKPLKKEDRKNGKYPVFGSNGVVGYHNKFLTKGPCIIIGRKGTAGEITYSEDDCFPIDTTFFIQLKNKDQYNLECLYFIMQMSDLKNLKTQSNVPGLNRNEAYKLQIPLPPLEEQKKIADILQKIDDKISIHRKKKSTLKELFKTMLKNLMTGQIRVHNLNINNNLQG